MPASRKPLKLHSAAQAELQESGVEAAFEVIIANPQRFRAVADLPGVQKLRLKHFPFALLIDARLTGHACRIGASNLPQFDHS